MVKKNNNKSFVEIKNNKKPIEEENIINPLDKYKYVEEKRKWPIKNLIIILFIIITILLIIILFQLIEEQSEKTKTNTNKQNEQQSMIINTQTTTTTTTKKEDKITESLTCSSSITENNMKIETQVTANFHNKKLRSDINYMKITLLDENNKKEFDEYVSVLQMFSMYLIDNPDYKIDETIKDNEFTMSIKTTYQIDKTIESNLQYDEDYESVKQKLIELGHECK